MRKTTIIFTVTILLAAISVTAAQQKKKSTTSKPTAIPAGGEPVSAATNQKAKEIAEKFWNSRIIKCGSDVWYTLDARSRNVIVYELREQPIVVYAPTMRWRSKLDVMNGVEGSGAFGVKSRLMRTFETRFDSELLPTGYKNDLLPPMDIDLYSEKSLATPKIQISTSDVWHRPFSCEDVENYINKKKPFPSKTFVCLKRNGANCWDNPPSIEGLSVEQLEDTQVSPRLVP